MLVYLFRRTCDRALSTDVTGRNLPSRRAAIPWMFVEALRINKSRRPLSAEALRQLHQVGYYILAADA